MDDYLQLLVPKWAIMCEWLVSQLKGWLTNSKNCYSAWDHPAASGPNTQPPNFQVFVSIHLRNLLTHTLLFWHFLENLYFEFKNTFGYIRTMFSGNTCLFSEKTDPEHLKYWSLSWKLQKTTVTNFQFFKQINTENRIATCQCSLVYLWDINCF